MRIRCRFVEMSGSGIGLLVVGSVVVGSLVVPMVGREYCCEGFGF
jgi:hypothetical protein